MYISTAHTHGSHLLGPTLGIGATHGHPTLTQVGLGDHGATTDGTALGMILGTIPVITTDGTTPTITTTIPIITDTIIITTTITDTMIPITMGIITVRTTTTTDAAPVDTTTMDVMTIMTTHIVRTETTTAMVATMTPQVRKMTAAM